MNVGSVFSAQQIKISAYEANVQDAVVSTLKCEVNTNGALEFLSV